VSKLDDLNGAGGLYFFGVRYRGDGWWVGGGWDKGLEMLGMCG
jgi:hypothetical protein